MNFEQRHELFRLQLAAGKAEFEAELRADCENDPVYAKAFYDHLYAPEQREQFQNFRRRIFPGKP